MHELEAGQKIRIKINLSSLRSETITCVIKWFEDDRIALVFPDEHEYLKKNLPEGKEIEAVAYTDSGIFAFDSIVINSPLEHDFVIEMPDEKKRIQRRDYVRAAFNLKFVIKNRDKEIDAKTVNIGGGGVRFLVKEELKPNSYWDFKLTMPDETIIRGGGTVLYSFLQGQKIISVIKFIEITETDRNRIIKKCFEEEVKNIKLRKMSEE